MAKIDYLSPIEFQLGKNFSTGTAAFVTSLNVVELIRPFTWASLDLYPRWLWRTTGSRTATGDVHLLVAVITYPKPSLTPDVRSVKNGPSAFVSLIPHLILLPKLALKSSLAPLGSQPIQPYWCPTYWPNAKWARSDGARRPASNLRDRCLCLWRY